MTHRVDPSPPQIALCGAELQPEHAPVDEYSAFLDRTGLSAAYRSDLARRRCAFAARWPELRDWLRMPLLERVGRPNGKSRRDLRDRVSYNARSYLIYLCLTDRLRLDYDYLLAVGQIQTMYLSRLLCGDFGVAQLADEAQGLGFWRFSADLAMRWTLPRIALHTGIRDPSLLRLEHLDELTLAMRPFNKRPDFALFWPETPGRKRLFKDRPTHDVWFGHISRLRNVLYHRGQIAGPPRAGRRLEVRPPPVQPEMRAVVDRWLDLYRPVSRPSTTYHRELALRRFLDYLAQADPLVQRFAQVTREHALGFIDAIVANAGKLSRSAG